MEHSVLRNVSAADHAVLIGKIFGFLTDGNGRIPADYLASQVKNIDKTTGDIDTLSKRLAFIRTWTYVSQRDKWTEDSRYWREETRRVEDKLSDALHGALTERFVDRRTSVLMRRLKQRESLVAEVNKDGEVRVDDQFIGRLEGFRFRLDPKASNDEAKTLRSAGIAALKPEFSLRADRMYNAPDSEFDLTEQGGLMWGTDAVGKLSKGADALSPTVDVFVDDEAGSDVAEKVARRLSHWIERRIEALFEPLIAMRNDEGLTGLAKGIGFQLVEALGVVERQVIAQDVKSLDQDGRGLLRKHGVRFGQYTIFQAALLKPAPTRLRLVLKSLFDGLDEFPEAPPPGLVTVPAASSAPLMVGMGYNSEAGEREKVKGPAQEKPKEATSGEPESPADDQKPEDAPKEEEKTAAPSAEDSPETAKTEAEAEAPENETFYVFTWKPKPRANRQPSGNKPSGKRPQGKGKGPRRGEKPTGAKKFSSGGPKKAKEVDPDNPFAALAALKGKS